MSGTGAELTQSRIEDTVLDEGTDEAPPAPPFQPDGRRAERSHIT